MKIQVGFEMNYYFPQRTPMVLLVNIHPSRVADIVIPERVATEPWVPQTGYHDSFGNWCTRIVAPAGPFQLTSNAVVGDTGFPDPIAPYAMQQPVENLPAETLLFLLGSRYCETEFLLQTAWNLFGQTAPGWARVQAICDYVHNHITFGYENARRTRTAWEAFNERVGVCRDYAHLAIALCRCMNIPARYCTGYLGDMGTPPPYPPGDFAAWFEVYLGGSWHTFDPRNNAPRIGRVLMARGRDAADVAMVTTFGMHTLQNFKVWTDELEGAYEGAEQVRVA
jgi:transglutaminase-like putative cysteine protease